jgi:putative oxidoreductase
MLQRAFPSFPKGRVGAALLLLRAFTGVAFLFHGYGKITDIAAFAEEFNIPVPLAACAAYAQLIGGLLLVVGLLTPAASLAVAATMAAAVVKLIGRGEAFVNPEGHSWEAAGFYLAANVCIALLGPGAYSLDGLLFRGRAQTSERMEKEIRAPSPTGDVGAG